MDTETDKLVALIRADRLSPVVLTHVLLEYSRNDRSALEKLISAANAEILDWVYDILTTYPQTDVGWRILPTGRSQFVRPDFDRHELADLEHRQYQEDRPHVEYLRGKIRP